MHGNSRDRHDRVLASYGRPAWLVASKADPAADTIHTEGADLRHDYWFIRSANPELVKDSDVPIDFTRAVHVDALRLNELPSDLLTAKILVVESMNGHLLEKKSARKSAILAGNYAWFVRWRLGLGVSNNADISPPLIEDFFEKLRQGGLWNLIPLKERVVALTDRISAGGLAIPRQKGRIPELTKVYAELGIATKRPPAFCYHAIRDALQKFDPTLRFKSESERNWRRMRGASAGSESGIDAGLGLDSHEEGALPTADRSMSVAHAELVLLALEALYRLSCLHAIEHDELSFDPFLKASLYSRATQIGRPQGRTATLRPEQWLALLDGAAKWMLDYSGPALTLIEQAKAISLRVYGQNWSDYASNEARDEFRDMMSSIIDNVWPKDAGLPGVGPSWKRVSILRDKGHISLTDTLYYLITANLVLIAAFTGRRSKELVSLKAGCAELDPTGVWWISSYIEKTIRDIDRIPVPATVGAAVRMLEGIGQEAREITGEPWLSTILLPSNRPINGKLAPNSKRYHFNPSTMIDDFAQIIDMPKNDDGSLWDYASHQLRRAFAIYYYYGYRYANLDALSRFLRHFDPEMTRIYITDVIPGLLMALQEKRDAYIALAKEAEARGPNSAVRANLKAVGEIKSRLALISDTFREVKEEATVGRLLEVYDGLEAPIGRGAATLFRDIDELVDLARRDVRIGSPNSNGAPDEVRESFVAQSRRYAKAKNIEPVPGGQACCGWSPALGDDLSDAACIQEKLAELESPPDDSRPDYAYASIETCLECRFCLVFSENRRIIDGAIAAKAEAADKAPSVGTKAAARDKVAAYKRKVGAAELAARGSA